MKSTPLRVAWRALLPAHDTAWLIQMSLMLFVLLLPTSSYVAALPFIQEEWGLNNTQAGGIY